MTKNEMIGILSGKKPVEETKTPNEKVLFSHKCCHLSKEQSKLLADMAFIKDQQESCRKMSHFIGENIDDERVKSALQGCVVCLGWVFNPFKLTILKECIAFTKDGFLTYSISINPCGFGLVIDIGAKLELTPFPDGVVKDAYIGFMVHERKKILTERVEKSKFDMYLPLPDDEIADVVLKGIVEVMK